MTRRPIRPIARVLLAAALFALGCGGRMPKALAEGSGRFAPCPASPNCVSSEARDEAHAIAAYRIRGEADAAWRALTDHLRTRERVEIATLEADYLHAVFKSALMGYRDDVEFRLDPGAGVIRLRSASRLGYGDMGANRDRIESIRAALAQAGFVDPGAAR